MNKVVVLLLTVYLVCIIYDLMDFMETKKNYIV